MPEAVTLKRSPLPDAVPVSQKGRYSLLGQRLLRREAEAAALFTEKWFSVRETAKLLGIGIDTTRTFIRKGLFPGARRAGKQGWMYIPASGVRAFLEKGVPHE